MKILQLAIVALLLSSAITSFAQDKNEWDVRVRAICVLPQESATISVIGGGVNISNTYVPEVDFTYFFARNFSAELILATTKHNVSTASSNLTPIGSSAAANVNLGHVWLLPPTLTLQYHLPTGTLFKPYIGAGANYTIFYSADQGSVVQDIDYKNKFAFAAQLGADFDISKKMFLNIDVKKLFLSTDASVNAANLTPSGSPSLAPVLSNINADVKINPWVIGIGIGYRLK